MGTRVLVLGGGPDAEREVSLVSSRAVAEALSRGPGEAMEVEYRVIERVTVEELRSMPGDVVFPVLHGGWGEGGPLQDVLEADGRPYVGCGSRAARLAMDKIATKLIGARAGVGTTESALVLDGDEGVAIRAPLVCKPVHEGSSVGVHLVRDASAWPGVRAAVRADRATRPGRMYFVEPMVLGDDGGRGRELTVGVLDGEALPVVEIVPGVEFYDYEAKYQRDDTRYVVGPTLPPGVAERVRGWAVAMARALGVRHLCRVDFMFGRAGGSGDPGAYLLEVNTMPGFTSHSLLPMAAASVGLDFGALVRRLVGLALRDAGGTRVGGGDGGGRPGGTTLSGRSGHGEEQR